MTATATLLRKNSRSGYTHLANDILQDSTLSYRARGIAAYLLSKPDDWAISIPNVARDGVEGAQTVTTAMRELAAAGYLKRIREQNPDGTWRTVTLLADYPAYVDDGTVEERVAGYSVSDSHRPPQNRGVGNRGVGKGGVLLTTEDKITDTISPLPKTKRGSTKSAPVLTSEWRDALMFVLMGHENMAMLTKVHWKLLKDAAKQLTANGYTPELVKAWAKGVWYTRWPGLQSDGRTRPASYNELMQGLALAEAEANEPDAPAVRMQLIKTGDDDDWA